MKKRAMSFLLAVLLLLPNAALARDEQKNADPDKYYILLDLNNQIVTVFEKDDAGKFTKIVRRFICSSGRTKLNPEDPEDVGSPTPRGIYKTGGHERFGKFAAFGATYARYWTQIVGGVFFHSIMFSRRDVNTLNGGAYANLGRNVSHGCVRLYVEDAKWLYYYIPQGTTIRVSTSEPPAPKLKKALKSTMPFKTYKVFQKVIYDEPELPNYTAWVTKAGADVRSGNGSNDSRLFTLKAGTPVEVLLIGDPWIKVRVNKREGYIKNAFLTFEEGKTASTAEADVMKTTKYLLAEPQDKADVIVKIPQFTSVKVLERTDDWLKVEYSGETGYVRSKYLKKDWGIIRE